MSELEVALEAESTRPAPPEPWWWSLVDPAGVELDIHDEAPEFTTRADAETWIGETYPRLRTLGVDAAVLHHGTKAVSAPLSLHE